MMKPAAISAALSGDHNKRDETVEQAVEPVYSSSNSEPERFTGASVADLPEQLKSDEAQAEAVAFADSAAIVEPDVAADQHVSRAVAHRAEEVPPVVAEQSVRFMPLQERGPLHEAVVDRADVAGFNQPEVEQPVAANPQTTERAATQQARFSQHNDSNPEPRVHIGRVDVIVVSAQKSESVQAKSLTTTLDFASRNYLRRL